MSENTDEALGRTFRSAWIAGVNKHYPGEPKPGYIAPWDETPAWEQAAATAVATQIRDFLDVSAGAATRLTPEQKGRFVALCWIGQIYKHIEDPKPSYTADWEQLPEWQQATDIEIFEAVATLGPSGRPIGPQHCRASDDTAPCVGEGWRWSRCESFRGRARAKARRNLPSLWDA